ncbi:MAG: GAF domain-containing protein [Actinomycetota bacterium]|nr:GAF domain-containing protein [Actinomycetota bacterium]
MEQKSGFWNEETVLLAEHDAYEAGRVCKILQKNNYSVLLACNGEQAFDTAVKSSPCLVLAAVDLPGTNGFDLCKQIKNEKTLAGVPVFLSTPYSETADILKALECEADNLIVKPYVERALLTRMEFTMSNLRLHRHNRLPSEGIEIFLKGRRHVVTSGRQQILNLLVSMFEAVMHKQTDILKAEEKLKTMNENLERINLERTSELIAEIGERKKTEGNLKSSIEALNRANRALRTVNACNRAMVRASGEEELLQDVCRAIVELGGFRLAWAGCAAQGLESKDIRLLSLAGFADHGGSIHGLPDTEFGAGRKPGGPVPVVIRSAKHVLVDDILSDQFCREWKDEALKYGLASALVIPLVLEARCFGVLCVCSAEKEAFGQDEIRFLNTIANDLVYGLAALGRQEARA